MTWRNWNPGALLVGMSNGAATVETSMAVPKNSNNRITIWYSNSNSGSILKRIESGNLKRYLYTHVHSHIIHGHQKMETIQVVEIIQSTGEWISGMFLQPIEYYSATKRNEVLTHASQHEWTSEIGCWMRTDRHKNTNTVWFHLYEVIRFIQSKSRMVPEAGGGGWGISI